MSPRVRLLLALAVITLAVWWVSNYTAWLGPYGAPGDVYHLVILVAVLLIVFMLAWAWARRGGRR